MKAQKKQQEKYSCAVKLIIIGDSGVGKTNVLLRFCSNEFKQSYVATIGVDFKIKTIQVDDKRIKLQIWDTAGQQRFKNINQTYYKGAIGIILAYSITDLNSFSNVENWMKQIHDHSSADVKKILVANKCDMEEERKVTKEQGKKLAEKYAMPFLEVSAKDGTNVEEIFQTLGREIKDDVDRNEKAEEAKKRVSLANTTPTDTGGCKC